jgi:putative ABC transport system ATP-binding protein
LQRVAIARALVHAPPLLLADEPTGNLDPATAEQVMDLLRAQARASGAALVLVTHSAAAAARADRVLHLSADGIRAGRS